MDVCCKGSLCHFPAEFRNRGKSEGLQFDTWVFLQGFFPRFNVVHTSRKILGQVYIPLVNYTLMTLTLLVVGIFEKSSKLGQAYGENILCTSRDCFWFRVDQTGAGFIIFLSGRVTCLWQFATDIAKTGSYPC